MRKLFFILTALCFSLGINAGEDNLITMRVPDNLNIKDKIVISNKSSCTILRAVVVLMEGSQYEVLGTCNIIAPGGAISIADFDRNGLRHLRGRTIGIKIKGVKKMMMDRSITSIGIGPISGGISKADIKADDFNNIEEEEITYDFSVSLSEYKHDLYILVFNNTDEGGILNF